MEGRSSRQDDHEETVKQEEEEEDDDDQELLALNVKKTPNHLNLPSEVIKDILSRLPVKPLVRLRSVSKSWCTLLTTDSNFIYKHLTRSHLQNDTNIIFQNHYLDFYLVPNALFDETSIKLQSFCTHYESFSAKTRGQLDLYFTPSGTFDQTAIKLDTFRRPDDEGIDILCYPNDDDLDDIIIPGLPIDLRAIGSCNGLVCLTETIYHSYNGDPPLYLWNPSIRQCKKVPLPHTRRPRSALQGMGFGFHPEVNDYKVVILVPFQDCGRAIGYNIEVEVYSLSTNCWQRLGDFPYNISYAPARETVNGKLHWAANHGSSSSTYPSDFILSFDLVGEVFQEVPMPENLFLDEIGLAQLLLRTFKGCLSMFVITEERNSGELNLDVWLMTQYGAKESWTKLFTIDHDQFYMDSIYPIDLLKNGKLIFNEKSLDTCELVSYDPESEEFEGLEIVGAQTRCGDVYGDAVHYVESLVSLQKEAHEKKSKEETLKRIGRNQDDDREGKQKLFVKEENKSSMTKTHDLPPEVIEEILSKLPVKPLVRFKCVSKSWCSLLTTNSNFIQKQLHRANDVNQGFVLYLNDGIYSIPNETFEKPIKLDGLYTREHKIKLVGSSNGLICLTRQRGSGYENIYIWNPSIRDCKRLRRWSSTMNNMYIHDHTTDFGYLPTINDYKVVRLEQFKEVSVTDNSVQWTIDVHVYSLSMNRWRRLGSFPYYISYSNCNSRAIVNGIVHRAATSGSLSEDMFILSFDMAKETHCEVPMPESFNQKSMRLLYLRTYKGCLSMFVMNEQQTMDVWLMKEYGAKESWTKLFILEYQRASLPTPIEFLKNGELLLKMYDANSRRYNFMLYNSETETLKELEVVGACGAKLYVDAVRYVESLVPLMRAHNEVKEDEQEGQSNEKKKLVEERD